MSAVQTEPPRSVVDSMDSLAFTGNIPLLSRLHHQMQHGLNTRALFSLSGARLQDGFQRHRACCKSKPLQLFLPSSSDPGGLSCDKRRQQVCIKDDWTDQLDVHSWLPEVQGFQQPLWQETPQTVPAGQAVTKPQLKTTNITLTTLQLMHFINCK